MGAGDTAGLVTAVFCMAAGNRLRQADVILSDGIRIVNQKDVQLARPVDADG
jgi:hypothetical protein